MSELRKGRNFYNENNSKAAEWIRQLIQQREIPDGDVDERSIEKLSKQDVDEYAQCHFFAGISGWSKALELGGWETGRQIWTGSCPCPPFSSAGKKKKCPACGGARPVPCPRRTGYFICLACEHAWYADGRHLWPEFHRLIRECRPAVIIGEQVAGPDGVLWFAGVRASLERSGYAAGGSDLAAASVGAPHIRQRIYWMAHTNGGNSGAKRIQRGGGFLQQPQDQTACGLVLADSAGRISGEPAGTPARHGDSIEPAGHTGGLGHSESHDKLGKWKSREKQGRKGSVGRPGAWDHYEVLPCYDGKARRTQPGIHPLAYGVSGRVELLRGYGNAIVPELAAKFIKVVKEIVI